MAGIKSVMVGGVTYNVAHASAVDQSELVQILMARVMVNAAKANVEGIDSDFLLGVLTSLPVDTLNRVAAIALCKTVKHGTAETVDISNFQGSMLSYYQLIVAAVKVNLDDFFIYLGGEKRSAPPVSGTTTILTS